jgi:hypothetical protein
MKSLTYTYSQGTENKGDGYSSALYIPDSIAATPQAPYYLNFLPGEYPDWSGQGQIPVNDVWEEKFGCFVFTDKVVNEDDLVEFAEELHNKLIFDPAGNDYSLFAWNYRGDLDIPRFQVFQTPYVAIGTAKKRTITDCHGLSIKRFKMNFDEGTGMSLKEGCINFDRPLTLAYGDYKFTDVKAATLILSGPRAGCIDAAITADLETLKAVGGGEFRTCNENGDGFQFPLFPDQPKKPEQLGEFNISWNVAAPLDAVRTHFAFADTPTLLSHFRTPGGQSLSIQPVEHGDVPSGFCFARSMRTFLDGKNLKFGPSDPDYYLAPSGPFKVIKPSAAEQRPLHLMCGVSGSEYLLLHPEDKLCFLPHNEESDGSEWSTTWATIIPAKLKDDTTVGASYCKQPDGTAFFDNDPEKGHPVGAQLGDLEIGHYKHTQILLLPFAGVNSKVAWMTPDTGKQVSAISINQDYELQQFRDQDKVSQRAQSFSTRIKQQEGPVFFNPYDATRLKGLSRTANGLMINLHDGTEGPPAGTLKRIFLAKGPDERKNSTISKGPAEPKFFTLNPGDQGVVDPVLVAELLKRPELVIVTNHDKVSGFKYKLNLVSVATKAELLDAGKSLVIVAMVGTAIRIRIFDLKGKKVVDKPETELKSGPILTELKNLLKEEPFPDVSEWPQKKQQEVIEKASSLSDLSFGNEITLGDFPFKLDVGPEKAILLFKFALGISLEKIITNAIDGNLALTHDFLSGENMPQTLERIQKSIDSAKASKAADSASVETAGKTAHHKPAFGHFLKLIKDPDWTGFLVLNCPLNYDKLPADILTLIGGIRSKTRLQAHHIGATINRPKPGDNKMDPIQSSSLFAVIYHENQWIRKAESRGMTYEQASEDWKRYELEPRVTKLKPIIKTDFETLRFEVLFENSKQQLFTTRIALTTPELFGGEVMLKKAPSPDSKPADTMVIDGRRIHHPDGTGSFVFEWPGDLDQEDQRIYDRVFTYVKAGRKMSALQNVTFSDLRLRPVKTKSADKSITAISIFELDSDLDFFDKKSSGVDSPLGDLFSYKALRLEAYGLNTTVVIPEIGEITRKMHEDLSGSRIDVPVSTKGARVGSLIDRLPLHPSNVHKVKNWKVFAEGGWWMKGVVKPGIVEPLPQGEGYAVEFDFPMGSTGGQSKSPSQVTARVCLAWSARGPNHDDDHGIWFGLRSNNMNLQGIMKTSLDDVRIVRDSNQAYFILLENYQVHVFGHALPKHRSSMVLTPSATNPKGKLAWLLVREDLVPKYAPAVLIDNPTPSRSDNPTVNPIAAETMLLAMAKSDPVDPLAWKHIDQNDEKWGEIERSASISIYSPVYVGKGKLPGDELNAVTQPNCIDGVIKKILGSPFKPLPPEKTGEAGDHLVVAVHMLFPTLDLKFLMHDNDFYGGRIEVRADPTNVDESEKTGTGGFLVRHPDIPLRGWGSGPIQSETWEKYDGAKLEVYYKHLKSGVGIISANLVLPKSMSSIKKTSEGYKSLGRIKRETEDEAKAQKNAYEKNGQELKKTSDKIKTNGKSLKKMQGDLDAHQQKLSDSQSKLDKSRKDLDDSSRNLADVSKSVKTLENNIHDLNERINKLDTKLEKQQNAAVRRQRKKAKVGLKNRLTMDTDLLYKKAKDHTNAKKSYQKNKDSHDKLNKTFKVNEETHRENERKQKELERLHALVIKKNDKRNAALKKKKEFDEVAGRMLEMAYDIRNFQLALEEEILAETPEFHLGNISLAIFIQPVPGFRISLGWPITANPFEIEMPAKVSSLGKVVPFFKAGLYFAFLQPEDLPGTFGATGKNDERLVPEFGYMFAGGLAIGGGKKLSGNKGLFEYSASIEIDGIIQVYWAKSAEHTDGDYHWVCLQVSVTGALSGKVNLVIIELSISLKLLISVAFAFETKHLTSAEFKASISAEGSLRIAFITIHIGFKTSISIGGALESGSGHNASVKGPSPQIVDWPKGSLPTPPKHEEAPIQADSTEVGQSAGTSSERVARSTTPPTIEPMSIVSSFINLPIEEVSPPTKTPLFDSSKQLDGWTNDFETAMDHHHQSAIEGEIPQVTIPLHFMVQVTAAEDKSGSWGPRGIASLFIDIGHGSDVNSDFSKLSASLIAFLTNQYTKDVPVLNHQEDVPWMEQLLSAGKIKEVHARINTSLGWDLPANKRSHEWVDKWFKTIDFNISTLDPDGDEHLRIAMFPMLEWLELQPVGTTEEPDRHEQKKKIVYAYFEHMARSLFEAMEELAEKTKQWSTKKHLSITPAWNAPLDKVAAAETNVEGLEAELDKAESSGLVAAQKNAHTKLEAAKEGLAKETLHQANRDWAKAQQDLEIVKLYSELQKAPAEIKAASEAHNAAVKILKDIRGKADEKAEDKAEMDEFKAKAKLTTAVKSQQQILGSLDKRSQTLQINLGEAQKIVTMAEAGLLEAKGASSTASLRITAHQAKLDLAKAKQDVTDLETRLEIINRGSASARDLASAEATCQSAMSAVIQLKVEQASQAALSRLAGNLSRFLLAGKNVEEPENVFRGLYELTGQQFTLNDGDNQVVLVSRDSNTDLPGPNKEGVREKTRVLPKRIPTGVTPNQALNWEAPLAGSNALANGEEAKKKWLFQHLPPLARTPKRFPLTHRLSWADGTTQKSIAPFADDLRYALENTAGDAGLLKVNDAEETEETAHIELHDNHSNWANAQPALVMSVSLRKVFNVSHIDANTKDEESSHGKKIPLQDVVELVGTDEAHRALLGILLDPDTKGKEDGFQVQVLTRKGSGMPFTSLSSDETHKLLLVKTNLSTATGGATVGKPPENEANSTTTTTTTTPTYFAPISDWYAFLRLVWEASVVHSGGFYLKPGTIKVDDLFGDHEEIRVKLVVTAKVGNEEAVLNIEEFHNALVGDEPKGHVFATLYKGPNEMDYEYVPMHHFGELGIEIIDHASQPHMDAAPEGNNFNQLQIEHISQLYNVFYCKADWQNVWSHPIHGVDMPKGPGSTNQERHYVHVMPVPSREPTDNLYAAVGTDHTVQLRVSDIYGNVAPESHWPSLAGPLRQVYNDKVIGLSQWLGVRSTYKVSKPEVGSVPSLVMDLSFNETLLLKSAKRVSPKGVSPEELKRQRKERIVHIRDEYVRIHDQLKDPHLQVSIETPLSKDPLTGDIKEQLTLFVSDLLDWINEIATTEKLDVGTAKNSAPECTIKCSLVTDWPARWPWGDLRELTVDLVMERIPSSEIDDENPCFTLHDEIYGETDVRHLMPTVQRASTLIQAEQHENAADDAAPEMSLQSFAIEFEDAYSNFAGPGSRLKISTGINSDPKSVHFGHAIISVMRWRKSDETDPATGILVKRAQGDPLFSAPLPVNAHLITRTVDKLGSNMDEKAYSSVDLDRWAAEFLSSVEDLFDPKTAPDIAAIPSPKLPSNKPVVTSNPENTAYYKLAVSKVKLAATIKRTLDWIYQGDYLGSKRTPDQLKKALDQAKESMNQALLTSLENDYGTAVVGQIPMNVSMKAPIEPWDEGAQAPNIFGPIVTKDAEASAQDLPYSFSNAKLPLTPGEDMWLNFLVHAKSPSDQGFFEVGLDYSVNSVEHHIHPEEGRDGYVPSSWLSFVLPEDVSENKKTKKRIKKLPNTLTNDLDDTIEGKPIKTIIPVPLRSFPPNPKLLRQTANPTHPELGEAANADEEVKTGDWKNQLEQALEWDYHLEIEPPQAAQDSLVVQVVLNEEVGSIESTSNTSEIVKLSEDRIPLFEALARYRYELEELESTDLKARVAKIDSINALIQNVQSAWKTVADAQETKQKRESQKKPHQKDTDHGIWEFEISWEKKEVIKMVNEEPVKTMETTMTLTKISTDEFPWPTIELDGVGEELDVSKDKAGSPTYTYTGTARPVIKLTWRALFVLQYQSAHTGAYVRRNMHLAPKHAETTNKKSKEKNPGSTDWDTNPGFVYQTELVRFSSPVVPLIHDLRTISVEDESLEHAIANILDTIRQTDGEDPAEQLHFEAQINYSFELLAYRDDSIRSLQPIFLIEAKLDERSKDKINEDDREEAAKIPTKKDRINKGDREEASNITTKIENWHMEHASNEAKPALDFTWTLFATKTVKGDRLLPLVRFSRIEIMTKDGKWMHIPVPLPHPIPESTDPPIPAH